MFVNSNLIRGTICVIRSVSGKDTVLALENQRSYPEWSGCFSII